ncbi:MAG TPA: CCA tRNA nucleotidyltransferase [Acidobacteriaceae bacterium]|nr:CCA tRNA nucleotidyltransferase [Acidobacteriaceae bacterium]
MGIDHHYVLPPARQRAAMQIVERLRSSGHAAYFAGGCVRDLLLGREPSDFDVATSATPDVVLAMFPRTFAVGAHFGVVLVATQGPEETGRNDEAEILTEVATFRNDGSYSDGRRPDSVRYTASAEQDVLRRDFTINGMLLDPAKLTVAESVETAVLDYVGGLEDLHAGVVRAIGNPAQRLAEDKLRMLRAVRFAARFGFLIEEGTLSAIRAAAHQIPQVSQERVRDELTRMLTEGSARRAFELLQTTGLLRNILPEIEGMRGVEQPPQYHPEGDVWTHTLILLEQLPAGCSATLAWGALLHDVGKPPTFRRVPERIRFDGHVEVGVCMAEEICRRLRISNAATAQILELVANHMRFGDVKNMRASTLKRFFRLPEFPEHLALHRMDCMASHRDLSLYNFTREHFEMAEPENICPKPLVTGDDLITLGYRPGPHFKTMLSMAEDAQLEGRVASREQALQLIQSEFPDPMGIGK